MATGATFTLVTNDGKIDALLCATELLLYRLAAIRQEKAKNPQKYPDTEPTIADIARTHVFYPYAMFKPYVAMANEYLKVPSSNSAQLGNEVQLAIPQYGDFISDMAINVRLSAVACPAQSAPAQGVAGFPANGKDWDNVTTLAHSYYILVDAFKQQVTPVQGSFRNMLSYCSYPGERLMASVSLDVAGNSLGKYDHHVSAAVRKFAVSNDRLEAYKRMVGQEVEVEGYGCVQRASVLGDSSAQPSTVMQGGLAMPLPFSAANTSSLAQSGPIADVLAAEAKGTVALASQTPLAGMPLMIREAKKAVMGAQTAKYAQPELDFWHAVALDSCEDVSRAIPSVSIPHNNRALQVQLASQDKMLFEQPGLFVAQIIDVDGCRSVNYRPWVTSPSLPDGALTVKKLDLYINNIFVLTEVHDLFINKITFSITRLWTTASFTINTGDQGEHLLNLLKFALESICFGMQPAANAQSGDNWWKYCAVLKVQAPSADVLEVSADEPGAVAGKKSQIGALVPDTYLREEPCVGSYSLVSHNVQLYKDMPHSFYADYSAYARSGANLASVANNDRGSCLITFTPVRGQLQPGGHINLSRARETYIKWVKSAFSAQVTGTLYVVARAINFLLVTDGNAVIRFTT